MKEFINLMLIHNISKPKAEVILHNTIKRILMWNQIEALDSIDVQIQETFVNGEIIEQVVLVSFRIFHPILKQYQTIVLHNVIIGKTNYIKLED